MNKLFCSLYSSFGHRFPFKQVYEKGYFSRPFDKTKKKLLFLYRPNNPVAFSQLNPFLFYERDIAADFDVSVRALPMDQWESSGFRNADVVCVQTGFDLTDFEAGELFRSIRRYHPDARLVYFDWFAPLHLPLANMLDRHVDLYVKRQVFQDLKQYHQPTLGDTNLTDYYCREYNLDCKEHLFSIPPKFFQKLVLGPGLFTGSYLLNGFARGQYPDHTKTIDMHARFATKGTPWYTAMRNEALRACTDLNHSGVLTGNGVSRQQYLRELSSSKMCFSPFGYGEVCWRDFESILLGSLLIKPEMSHVRTEPNIYISGETYISVAWDLSDLQEKVEFYVNNTYERNRIVGNARQIMGDYVRTKAFVKQMAPVFHLAHRELVVQPAQKAQLDVLPLRARVEPRTEDGAAPLRGMHRRRG